MVSFLVVASEGKFEEDVARKYFRQLIAGDSCSFCCTVCDALRVPDSARQLHSIQWRFMMDLRMMDLLVFDQTNSCACFVRCVGIEYCHAQGIVHRDLKVAAPLQAL